MSTTPDEFRAWLEDWFRLWDSADYHLPEMMADTLYTDIDKSDWTVT